MCYNAKRALQHVTARNYLTAPRSSSSCHSMSSSPSMSQPTPTPQYVTSRLNLPAGRSTLHPHRTSQHDPSPQHIVARLNPTACNSTPYPIACRSMPQPRSTPKPCRASQHALAPNRVAAHPQPAACCSMLCYHRTLPRSMSPCNIMTQHAIPPQHAGQLLQIHQT